MVKTAVFEAMMDSNLNCMCIFMCFLAHLAIDHMSFYHQVSFVRRRLSLAFHILIFSSENTDQTWMALFQNCVRQLCRPSKMATITKNRNFSKWPKLLNFKPEWAQI